MTKRILLRIILLGGLSWLIPFVISFLFYRPGGELVVPYATFKTIITVVGTVSGCYLLVQCFKVITGDFVSNSILIGMIWFAINILLDTIFLIPLIGSSFANYFMSIGFSYLSIPAISVAMGYLLKKKNEIK